MKSLKTPVNEASLTETYTGADLTLLVEKHILVFPNGDQDDVQYNSRQEALNTLTEADDVIERVRKIFHSEKWGSDETEIQNYAIDYINEIAEQCGYKVNRVFKGVKR